ncbi:unnamed protein product [Polarella glacialis]|uniref:Uncharacterized protein n=1 Tax=Polarella glacialis TaxID=89957 RepID=A0A813K5A6_POLGL|nr:unnamed protein product [Polarella glacialis]CAE8722448.1 unnamed protein product [Polarella glacialis]
MDLLVACLTRPFDRALSLSFRIFWAELQEAGRRISEQAAHLLPASSARPITKRLGLARRITLLALEAILVGEALHWVCTAWALSWFWVYYALRVPAREVFYPAEFLFPELQTEPLSSTLGKSSAAAGHLLALPEGAARFLQFPEGNGHPSVTAACADVLLALPGHVASLDVALTATLASQETCGASPSLYRFQLLDAAGTEVTDSQAAWRPLILPARHWAIQVWSAVLWGPFIALGLVSADPDEIVAPLFEGLQISEQAREATKSARLCIAPPLLSFRSQLRLKLRTAWPFRLLQDRPILCSCGVALFVAIATWAVTGCLLLFVLLRHHALASASDAPPLASKTEGLSTALVLATEQETRKKGALLLPSEASVFQQARQTVAEGGSRALEMAASPVAQVTAASAATGAVALGTSGGFAGLVAGGVAGAAAGLIPAIFTFGLSIPVGFVLGSTTGAAAGAAVGGSVGIVGGGAAGYGIYSNRAALSEKATAAWDTADSYATSLNLNVYVPVELVRGRAISGTGSTTP